MKKRLRRWAENKLAVWARRVIKRTQPKVIGITGSIAKTSTKEAIYSVLRQQFGREVDKSPGNMNNELGMPLAILGFIAPPRLWQWPFVFIKAWWRGLNYKCQKIMVLEMGADKPGDIVHLTSIARPNVAVITAVGASHLEELKSIEGVAREKEMLIKSLPPDGMAILNGNDRYAVAMAETAPNKPILYFPGIDEIAQEAARAVGRFFGISEEKVEAGIKEANISGRLELTRGIKGSWIIDDSYNANPQSMEVALFQLIKLAREKECKRTVVVLGDMLELGDYSVKAHQELKKMGYEKVDLWVGIGKEMKKAGCQSWFTSSVEAIPMLLKEIREGDMILVKGSHGIHMEKIVQALRSK